MDVIGRWDDWKCQNCDSVNGPRTGALCDVCASDGEHGEVVELVRADAYRGAVSALEKYGQHHVGCSGAIHRDGDVLGCACGFANALNAIRDGSPDA